jgi:hypothetical protein
VQADTLNCWQLLIDSLSKNLSMSDEMLVLQVGLALRDDRDQINCSATAHEFQVIRVISPLH